MKTPFISAGLGLICFVLGSAIILFAHGGTVEDVSSFGRTLALAGVVILGAAIIAYAVGVNLRKP
jgi:hypothetical protein